MDKALNISEDFYKDEVICFLAERYHTSPQELLRSYCRQEEEKSHPAISTQAEAEHINLEENEMAILHDMLAAMPLSPSYTNTNK